MIGDDKIIEMAKQAGVADWYLGADDLKSATQQRHCTKLIAFTRLIEASVREECAANLQRGITQLRT